ncbi:conserved hypothetical protein [Perkinsus marinus ATCC 50983]|uniref:KH type-2 domain-containing protein n=1 Tax=Perkinsus marinus (strain ATCC 50983 / TXsc) TaxID=423536 RepID=C5LNU7_PERM5|nr:conserved hypothetical protein [Perkinsus marinus ATCC 50983]EER01596.1 conserved hypothetical protein [Perkinsus marinus ATCC 50983]|eukprot:XP_002768878.1 conserved hypothetical protein [Perkinsus marinus ATCC 50983]
MATAASQKQVSKKRKFVADGVFYAELNELLTTILAEDGYSGVEVRVTPIKTEIIIRATRTREVLGEKGRRLESSLLLLRDVSISLRTPSSSLLSVSISCSLCPGSS